MIQHVLEEAVASGIEQVCIVIRKGKELIREYFTSRYPYGHKRDESVEALEELAASCELHFVYQERPLGLGDALLQTKGFVGTDSFVMMVPDQFLQSDPPATSQLLKHWRPSPSIWSSLLKVPKEDVPFFAGARGFEYEEGTDPGKLTISRIRSEEKTRRLYRDLDYEVRGFGRTVFPPEIFDYFGKDFVNPESGEVDLLKTFEKYTEATPHYGVLLEGEPFDLGTFESYYHYLPRLWELSSEPRR